jgi:hypothetical protein
MGDVNVPRHREVSPSNGRCRSASGAVFAEVGLPADVGGSVQRFPDLQVFRCGEGVGNAQLVGEPQAGTFFDFTDGHLEDPEFVQLQHFKLVQVLGQQEGSALQISVVSESEDFPAFPRQRDVAVEAVILSEIPTTENAGPAAAQSGLWSVRPWTSSTM